MTYPRRVAAIALALALGLAACGEEKEETPAAGGSEDTAAAKKDCGQVTINENAWAGSTANVYIAKAVLEEDLGCEVEITKIAEIPVFQAMADGEVDAVLEDWQHVDEYKKYVDAGRHRRRTAARSASKGHIGWFIPKYLMDENPEFETWEGLKGNEELFKTAESGDQGMFLGGDPSYVQKDKELIEALDLNLKHVTAGAEPAQVARWSQLYKQEKPVIFYWYTPQYLNAEYDLAEVQLPPIEPGCKEDAKAGGDPEQYKCAYIETDIQKLFSKEFAESGSPAYDVLSQDGADERRPGRSWRSRSRATRSIRRRQAPTGSPRTATRSTPGSSSRIRGARARRITALAPAGASAAVDARKCRDAGKGARCGSVTVPLDRSGAVPGTIRIAFERYPRRDRSRPKLGTLLAIEGGPGYSTTDSRSYFMGLLRPLRARRDVLFVDLRGTGRSGPLDCRAFRRTVEDYRLRAARCARQLGPRRDFYGTHAAVDDVAAVLDALGIRQVDLYGDSYGTYAGQAFAVHHGDRLRSLVLDAAYPLPGTDPAYGDLAEATQRALRLVCERRPSCAARGEDPLGVVGRDARGRARAAVHCARARHRRPARARAGRRGRRSPDWSSPVTATCRCTATSSPRSARSRPATARRCCG